MRVILDTNVVTSALLWRGIPYQLLQAVRQRPNLADLIVSGDQDLLVIGQFEGIPILTARAALERLGTAPP